MAETYEVVVTIDEMKEQSAEACAFVAQGTTYRFKQNDWRKESGKPNLAGKFKVGSHVRLTCHDFSPEGKDWTQHWIDHAEKVGAEVPNSKADKPQSKRDNYKGGTKKSDFDPTLSARQTAAHVAGVLTQQTSLEDAAAPDVYATWQFYADEVAAWLNKRDTVGPVEAAIEALQAVPIPDDIDPAYEQASVDADDFWPTEDAPF